MSSNESASYTSIADIKKYWLENIAPSYFSLNDINNYTVGIFGYINEVMGNALEDSFNAVAVARREFYPVTAEFTSSQYAMATLQSIDIPLTTPATCKCALIIPQLEIIENSTYEDGLYECTIDSCLKIFAGELQFMLDYPIKIISKKTDRWMHTAHYDITVSNSLNTSTESRYISNKIINENGVNYVALFIDCIRQLEMTEVNNVIVKDSVMDTITMDIDFDGNLANFELFYKDSANSSELQLAKIMINGVTPTIPYAQYELVNSNRIRITFAYNSVFNPKYNSELICRIYTSKGAAGNFNSFSEDLVCSSDSETYPYNANMTILGKINGSTVGGKDRSISTAFRNSILNAYSTNNTNTTSHDLQLHFDNVSGDISNVRVLFKKRRDDAFDRLWGAYTVLKDNEANVIPTNTLALEIHKSDIIADLTASISRFSIPPGIIFEYKSDMSYTLVPSKKVDGSLKTLLDISKETTNKLYFTNPFAMGININPNNIGYYLTSIDKHMSIEYTYVNDSSIQQFIGGTLSLYRSAMCGSNYYKFSIKLTPASTIEASSIITINDPTLSANQIVAKYNGTVIKESYYYDDTLKIGYVRFTIEYDTTVTEDKYEYIQASNTIPIGGSSVTGYKMNFAVGDTFVKNDILATKRVSDLGKLLMCGDLNYLLYNSNYYMTFSIQDYDSDLEAYVLEAYLSTTDEIDITEKFTVNHGIFLKSGGESTSLALSMKNQLIEMNVLYQNDGKNIANKYSTFTGLEEFTLTNTYVSNENDLFSFISSLPFIRSTMDYLPGGISEDDYLITISDSPVIGALWATSIENYNAFVDKYTQINAKLQTTYYTLENNYSIDSKFYNTYGKARFYTIGINSSMKSLDSIRCKFHFGVKLNTVSSTDQFIESFRTYIKEYIESDDKITTNGQDIYIMNLIAELKSNFSEIAYVEYYGFNSYDYSAQTIIGPDLTDYQSSFIPEFLNLDTLTDSNGNKYPNIRVDIL